MVEPDLTVPGHPEIFVIGDVAHARGPGGNPLPGVATVAIQQGRYVASLLRNRLVGVQTEPFKYKDCGSMAIIGRAAAVADSGRVRLAGFGAWLIWLFVHLIHLIEYQNRLLVLIQWAWAIPPGSVRPASSPAKDHSRFRALQRTVRPKG